MGILTSESAPSAARAAIRAKSHTGVTAGLCGGYLQGNLAILPEAYASDFFRFCQRNPKPCPILGVSDPGDPQLPTLGADIDIRTDAPGYRVFERGVEHATVADISSYWRDDLVTFVLGCSFSFEEAMIAKGIGLRHIEAGRNVPMYRTSIQTEAAGPFRGEMVVSMRPLSPADTIRAVGISARYPEAHGTPIHFGDPAEIGIKNLDQPDFGDPVEIRDGEVPVFWACGVTPQVAIGEAKPDLSITHAPGHMLITDLRGAHTGLAA